MSSSLSAGSPTHAPLVVFEQFAAKVKGRVEAQLDRVLGEVVARAEGFGEPTEWVASALRSLTMRGGKRFRAVLLAAAFEACGGQGGPELVAMAGAALELLQAYLLIHDDWMDGDETRRGGPSAHALLRERFGSQQAGAVSAILAGDLGAGLAQAVLLSAPIAAELLLDACREFARIQADVVLGQVLDVHAHPADRAAVEVMHDLKTTSYTVRGPLLMGAALAGASVAQRAGLERFAKPLGLAFQLRDDLLGTFGDPRTTGKPAGNDVRQGKRTALIAELGDDPTSATLVARICGVDAPALEDVDALVAHLVAAGARARVEQRLAGLLDEAQAILRELDLVPSGRAVLEGAIYALGVRDQ